MLRQSFGSGVYCDEQVSHLHSHNAAVLGRLAKECWAKLHMFVALCLGLLGTNPDTGGTEDIPNLAESASFVFHARVMNIASSDRETEWPRAGSLRLRYTAGTKVIHDRRRSAFASHTTIISLPTGMAVLTFAVLPHG